MHGEERREALWKRYATRLRTVCEDRAQSTVEYAAVLAAFLAVVAALALLWRASAEGVLARIAEQALSHGMDMLGALDIVLY